MALLRIEEPEDGIVVATLASPQTRNAIGAPEHFDEIDALCRKVREDLSVRVLVLTGEGSAFCAGGDIRMMHDRVTAPGARAIDERYEYKASFHRLPLSLHDLEVPTIAAINGAAIGAGLDLACMCDVRIAADTAVFAESFVTLGIIPGDGGAWLLPRIVGRAKAAEMTFTGQRIDARKALEIGLVSEVVPPAALLESSLSLARRIAANPGHVLRMSKRLMREGEFMQMAPFLELCGAFQALAHHTKEHHDRLSAAVARLGKNL